MFSPDNSFDLVTNEHETKNGKTETKRMIKMVQKRIADQLPKASIEYPGTVETKQSLETVWIEVSHGRLKNIQNDHQDCCADCPGHPTVS
jgi:hypothetical protein